MMGTTPCSLDTLSPLHLSVMSGNPKAVGYWLDQLADPNVRDVYQRTPLHHAADAGNFEIVAMLLETKADPTPTVTAN